VITVWSPQVPARDEHTAASPERFFTCSSSSAIADGSFTEPGKVGLWTKADSVTLFDNFNYGGK
jgi:hypothetical protein